MALADLSDTELMAYIGLARLIVRADLDFSDEEEAELHRQAESVGMDRWARVMVESTSRARSRSEVLALAEKVVRPRARATILETLIELAGADELVDAEQRVIDEVRALWG